MSRTTINFWLCLNDGTRTLYGVGTLIVLLQVVGVAVAWFMIQPSTG
jgi:hypothetical protein